MASGRLVSKEVFDSATRETRELESAPLVASPDAAYLEARVEGLRLPARLVAKVRFDATGPEHRFDFAFDKTTVEPEAGTASAPAPVVLTLADPIPARPEDIVSELSARNARLQQLIVHLTGPELAGTPEKEVAA